MDPEEDTAAQPKEHEDEPMEEVKANDEIAKNKETEASVEVNEDKKDEVRVNE